MRSIKTQKDIETIKHSSIPSYYKVKAVTGLYLYVGVLKKSFKYRYMIKGKRYEITINTNSLEFAVSKAKELHILKHSKENPKYQNINNITFETLLSKYLKRFPYTNKTYINIDKRLIKFFGEINLANIERSFIENYLESLSYSIALLIETRLKSIFVYAVNRNYLSINPLKELKIDNLIQKPRIQSHKAIDFSLFKSFVNTIKEAQIKPNIKEALLFSLCIPLRANEIRLIENRFFNKQTNILFLPSKIMKTNKAYEIELKGKALEYFLSAFNRGNKYTFSLNRINPLSQNTITNYFKKLCNITTHQTRSTFSTYCYSNILRLRELQIYENDIELTLSHSVGSKTQNIYNQSTSKELISNLIEWWQNEIHKAV